MDAGNLKRAASEEVENDRGAKFAAVGEKEEQVVGWRMTLPVRLATPESDGSGDEEDYHVNVNVVPRLALLSWFEGRDIGDVLPLSLQPKSWNNQEQQWEKKPVSEWRDERVEALMTLAGRTKSEAQFVQLLEEKVAARRKIRNKEKRWVADDQRPLTVKEIVAVADKLPFAADELPEEQQSDGEGSGGEFE